MDGLVSETDQKASQIQSLVLNSSTWNACFQANNPQSQNSNTNMVSLNQPNLYSHLGSSNNIRQNNITMGQQSSSFDLQQSFILPNIDIESLLLEKQHLQQLTSPQSSPERNINNPTYQASQLQDYSDQLQRSMYLLQSTTAAHAINNNSSLNQQQQQQQPFGCNTFQSNTQNLSHSFIPGMPGLNSTSMHHSNANGYSDSNNNNNINNPFPLLNVPVGSFAQNPQVKSVCKSLLYEELLKTSQSGESQNNYHSSKIQQQQHQQLQIQSLNASSSGIYHLDMKQNNNSNNNNNNNHHSLKSEFDMQRDNISKMQFMQQQQQQEFSTFNESKGYIKSQFAHYQQQQPQHQGLMQNTGRQFEQTDSGNIINLRVLQQQRKQEKSLESPRRKDKLSEEKNLDIQLRQKFEVQLREFNLLKNQTRTNNNSEIESQQDEDNIRDSKKYNKQNQHNMKQSLEKQKDEQITTKRNISQTYFSSKEHCKKEIEMFRDQILTDYQSTIRVADILEKKSTFTENHLSYIWKRLSKQIILIRKQLENIMKLSVEDLIWENNVKEASKGLIKSGSAHLKKLLLLQPFEFKEASREIPRNMELICQKISSSNRKRKRTTSHEESPLMTCQGLEGNLESCLNKNEDILGTEILKKEQSDDGCAVYGDGGDCRHSQRCNSFSSQKRNSIVSCKKTSEDLLDSLTQISKSKIEGTIAELSEKNTEIFQDFNGNNNNNNISSYQRKGVRKYSNYSDSQMLLKYQAKSNRKRKTESFLEYYHNSSYNVNSDDHCSLASKEGALLIAESSEYEFRVEQDDITKSAFVGYVHKLTKERAGRGILMLQNGSVFYGYFKDNKPACFSGRLSSKNHIGYHGGFKEGLQSGNGTQLLRDSGHKYTGNFTKGKRSGFGTMQQKDGAYFTGHWMNDLPEEFGESQINTHLLKKDSLNHNSNANSNTNDVSCRDQSYQIYQGNWLNGKKHGTGILFTGVVAQWENDRFLRILS